MWWPWRLITLHGKHVVGAVADGEGEGVSEVLRAAVVVADAVLVDVAHGEARGLHVTFAHLKVQRPVNRGLNHREHHVLLLGRGKGWGEGSTRTINDCRITVSWLATRESSFSEQHSQKWVHFTLLVELVLRWPCLVDRTLNSSYHRLFVVPVKNDRHYKIVHANYSLSNWKCMYCQKDIRSKAFLSKCSLRSKVRFFMDMPEYIWQGMY